MKTATGTCKFCGQTAAIEVPESFTQEMVDEEVVKYYCKCSESQAFAKQQEMIANAEGAIKRLFEDKEELSALKNRLLSQVEGIARGEISSAKFSKNSYTAEIKPGKDSIKATLKHTEVDMVES